jgi:SNF2-related domain
MQSLSAISTLPQYLKIHGQFLTRKAIRALKPMHTPGKDPVPDFEDYPENRTPMEAQQHVAAGMIKCLDKHGSGFIIGEPGVGKTITSVAIIHEHARRSRRKGGRNGRYRAIIICPDHLIGKWEWEIESTIPEAKVHTIKKWHDILDFVGTATNRKSRKVGEVDRKSEVSFVDDDKLFAKAVKDDDRDKIRALAHGASLESKRQSVVHQDRKQWAQKWDAEWLILGRNQIKRTPDFCGLTGINAKGVQLVSNQALAKNVEVDRKDVLDDTGSPVYLAGWKRKTKGVFEKRPFCPKCGKVPLEKGQPMAMKDVAKKQIACEGLMLRELTKDGYGNDVLYEAMDYRTYGGIGEGTFPSHARRMKPGSKLQHAGKSWVVEQCKEPLFQWTHRMSTWPAAQIIQRKMRKWAQYLIVDEAHEQKGDESDQAAAMAKVLGTTHYCLAMTGTLIGGYADHLFPLLMRMAGREMKDRGFEWGGKMPFVERYGCIDRIVRGTTPVQATGRMSGSRGLKKVKIGSVSESRKPRPGIMPTLFSHLVMHRSIFLKLDQFIDDLPGFDEKVIACHLEPEVQNAYNVAAELLSQECSEMIARGNMKLLGTMLWTLLAYPDFPFDWHPMFPEAVEPEARHACGWWKLPKVYTEENFVGVCTPQNFTSDIILPKEQAIIDWSKELANKNEQHWIYTLLKQKHSPVGRLQQLLEKEGLRVGVLNSEDAPPREREEYINKVGRNVDVMISHPQLVATGLDLFNFTRGKHNFNNLSFYQTGYNLFTIRQASRRGYRIGQPLDCTVRYFYYANTMQAIAMDLMSRKAKAAMQLEEGHVSEEGLASMGGGGDQLALLNAISSVVDPKDIERNWGRVKSGQRGVKKKKPVVIQPEYVEPIEEEEIDLDEIDFASAPVEADEDDVDLDFDEDDLKDMFSKLGRQDTSTPDDEEW